MVEHWTNHYGNQSRCQRPEAVDIGHFGRRHRLCRGPPLALQGLDKATMVVDIGNDVCTETKWARQHPRIGFSGRFLCRCASFSMFTFFVPSGWASDGDLFFVDNSTLSIILTLGPCHHTYLLFEFEKIIWLRNNEYIFGFFNKSWNNKICF
jgi:hypothetical protein